MNRPQVITDMATLDDLSKVLSSGFLQDPKKHNYCSKIYNLLERSNIHLELGGKDFKKMVASNRMLDLLLSGSATHFDLKTEYQLSTVDTIDPEKIQDMIVLTKDYDSKISKLERQGILTLALNKKERIKYLKEINIFKQRNIELPKVLPETLPNIANALIIVDNYLLKNETASDQILHLLLKLIPDYLDIPFHLSFFGIQDNKPMIEKNLKDIKAKLIKARPAFAIVVNAYLITKNQFHDRELITNYHYASSGDGFIPASNRATNINFQFMVTDRLGVQPFTITNQLLKRLNNVVEDVLKHGATRGLQTIAFGDYIVKNRLLKE